MQDTIAVLKEIRAELDKPQVKTKELKAMIDECLKSPEVHIETPVGSLIAGISDNEAMQAYVCLETADNLIDLCLVDMPHKELRESAYKDLEEGDMQVLTWGDVYSEDYTHKDVIKASDIKELEGKTVESGITRYDEVTEDTIDEICAEFENLKFGKNLKVIITDVCGRDILLDGRRDFDPEAFKTNLSKEAYEAGYGDLYTINTSLVNKDGSCVELDEYNNIPITDLYSEVMEIAGIDMEYEMETER